MAVITQEVPTTRMRSEASKLQDSELSPALNTSYLVPPDWYILIFSSSQLTMVAVMSSSLQHNLPCVRHHCRALKYTPVFWESPPTMHATCPRWTKRMTRSCWKALGNCSSLFLLPVIKSSSLSFSSLSYMHCTYAANT